MRQWDAHDTQLPQFLTAGNLVYSACIRLARMLKLEIGMMCYFCLFFDGSLKIIFYAMIRHFGSGGLPHHHLEHCPVAPPHTTETFVHDLANSRQLWQAGFNRRIAKPKYSRVVWTM